MSLTEGERERDQQKQTQDQAFGLCTVYSSGGCTFLTPDHMTGEMGGVWERENNCWAKLTRTSDEGGEQSRHRLSMCSISFLREKARQTRAESWTKFNSTLNHQRLGGRRDKLKPLNINTHWCNDRHQRSISRSSEASWGYVSQTKSRGLHGQG